MVGESTIALACASALENALGSCALRSPSAFYPVLAGLASLDGTAYAEVCNRAVGPLLVNIDVANAQCK